MTTASIQSVRRRGLLLALLLICLCPRPRPSAPAALAQSGCAAPASAPDATPAALSPSGTIGLSYVASLGGDTAAAASVGGGQRLLFSRGADLGDLRTSTSDLQRLHTDERIQDIAAGAAALYLAIGQGGLLIASPDAAQRLGALRTPGLAAAVAIDGGRAYLAAAGPGGGLQVVDVADSAAPQLLGAAPTYGSAEDVAVAGGLAYVAEGLGGGVEIFDVANPRAPALRGALITPGAARGVAVDGDRAYLAAGPCGLQVVDVSDPAAPRMLGAVATGGEAQAVRIAGGRAYVAAGDAGLLVFALGGTAPQPVAARSFGPLAPIGDVDLDGGVAALAAGPSGALLVDIGDPALPTVAAAPTLGGVRAARAAAAEIYLALGAGGLAVTRAALDDPLIPSPRSIAGTALGLALGPAAGGKTTIYTAGGSAGLGVAQAASGGTPTPLRTISLPGSIGAILLDGDQAYAAAGGAGVHTLSLTDPLSPTLQATLDTPGAALDLARAGGLLYVADRAGLQVIDPATQRIIGEYTAPAGAFVQGVAVAGGRAYLADRAGLIVLDVGDPTNPAPLTVIDGFSAYAVAIQGTTLFVAAGKDGALAFDLGDPAAPRLAGRYDTPGLAQGVAPDGATLLVADGDGGLLRLRVIALSYQVRLPLIAR
ncbi:hypothetical protein K2Z83_24695 [Oscillochloris sp. ZM17-4]|uniref:LVIVD repeat-containing protein n=1 Tax=Oscillochloris sp. ZM17-4 TaxID=2866714 RepID=UPI001C72F92D|nr:hypothetical protein [Oscillochloris sp. ZM17-4]MBX0330862.1 hypothetical protein [Oscillochloris sp. ZM17-4]